MVVPYATVIYHSSHMYTHIRLSIVLLFRLIQCMIMKLNTLLTNQSVSQRAIVGVYLIMDSFYIGSCYYCNIYSGSAIHRQYIVRPS